MAVTVVDMAAVTRLCMNRFLGLSIADCGLSIMHEEPPTRDSDAAAAAGPSGEKRAMAQAIDPIFTVIGADALGPGCAETGVSFRAVVASSAESASGLSPYRVYAAASEIIAGMIGADLSGDGHIVRWTGAARVTPDTDPDDPRLRAVLVEIEAIASRESGDSVVSLAEVP